MDVFYSKLYYSFRNRIDIDKVDRIDNIRIDVEQSYEGANNFHFYVTIDNHDTFHMNISKRDVTYWGGIGPEVTKMHPRFEWIVDFENNNIYMGENNCRERVNHLWFVKEQKEKSLNRIKNLRKEYNQYLELQNKFK